MSLVMLIHSLEAGNVYAVVQIQSQASGPTKGKVIGSKAKLNTSLLISDNPIDKKTEFKVSTELGSKWEGSFKHQLVFGGGEFLLLYPKDIKDITADEPVITKEHLGKMTELNTGTEIQPDRYEVLPISRVARHSGS